MKKLFYFIPALFFLAGCSDDNELVQLPEQGEHYLANTPEVVRASVASSGENQSRTFVDGQNILWHKDDAISYFGGNAHNAQYVFEGKDGTALAEFKRYRVYINPNDPIAYAHAIYPYQKDMTSVLDGDTYKFNVNFPAQQTFAYNSFGRGANVMVAAGADDTADELFFRNACGFLVVNISGPNSRIKSIKLTSLDESVKLSGAATIAVKGGADPVTVMSSDASHEVTLDCTDDGDGVGLPLSGESAEFWFALPPVKMEKGFRIVVTDVDGNEFKTETHNPVEITRNEVQLMEAIRFIPPTHILKYNTEDGEMWEFDMEQPFDAEILSHEYDEEAGCYVITTKTPITTIREKAFYAGLSSDRLASITLPEKLTTIEDWAISAMHNVRTLTIPGSVTRIGYAAFHYSNELVSVTFEPSPTGEPLYISTKMGPSIDEGAFQGNWSLETVHINRNLIPVNKRGELLELDYEMEGIFAESPELKNVHIGPEVSYLPPFIFASTGIENIVIPGTLNSIGISAFVKCSKLKHISFAPSPSETPLDIGFIKSATLQKRSSFYYSPLRTIALDRELVYKDDEGNNYYPKDREDGIFSCNLLDRDYNCQVTLGKQVKKISAFMFNNNTMTSIEIPNTVKEIEEYAFAKTELNSISIPASVKSIGNFAFDDCENLSSVTFENGSEPLTIGFQPHINERGPFFDSPLTYIYLDRELKLTDEYAEALDDWDEGVFAYDYWDDESITTEVSMQGNVKTIHPYMFSAVRMTGCWIPKEVQSIGDEAFSYCEQLGYLTMGGANPPALGEDVFYDCDALREIVVPAGSINNYKKHSAWGSWGFRFLEWK